AFDFPRTNPLARFILISPDLVFRVDDGEHYSYDIGTPRYDWTKGQIEDAKAKGIPWVIVGFHKNCIGAGEHHCETGTDILNLLIQEKVDLVLNAHEHNYERSHQLAYTDSCPQGVQEHVFVPGCIVHDGTDGKYQRGDGSVVVIQGTGGREIDDFNQSDPTAGYFAAYMATDTVGAANGVVTYSVYADRLEERTSFNGTYADSFTIGEFTPGLFGSPLGPDAYGLEVRDRWPSRIPCRPAVTECRTPPRGIIRFSGVRAGPDRDPSMPSSAPMELARRRSQWIWSAACSGGGFGRGSRGCDPPGS